MRTTTRILLAGAAFAIVLALPHLATSGSGGASSDLGLARQLAQGSLAAFAIAFAGGVLTSLTPCVYPLIPITVSIFGAKTSRSRPQAMALSGLYVLGIAVTYSALGASAAITGKAFGTVMQNPWVLGLVAVVFLAMAASMFGAFELQLPASLQARLSRVGGAGYAGALAMGLVAGLIAAPCTGPVLAAALAFVATQGSVAYGVAIMFTYALGIGLLFFVIGAFSVSLPKSGAWMETVKSLFGVALLVLGVVYANGVGSARAREAAKDEGIAWLVNMEVEGLARARGEHKPVVIDFWGDWCAACKELDHTAWSDPRVREEMKRFVAVKMDNSADKMDDPKQAKAVDDAMAKYGILGQPTVVFIDAKGRELPGPARVTAVVDADEMLKRLQAGDRVCGSAG